MKHRALVDAIRATGCVDCGYDEDIAAIEFDHVRGKKKGNVSVFVGAGLPTLMKELAKCEVVCANCHAIRTARRRQGA